MSKSIKRFLLASVLSFATLGAALATDGPPPGVGTGNGHASAAPACDTHRCSVLATDGPGSPGDNTGRSMASATSRSSQIPALWRPVLAGGGKVGSDFHASAATTCDTDRCPVLAGDGGPGNPTDRTGRSAEVTTWHPMLAGGGVRTGDISF